MYLHLDVEQIKYTLTPIFLFIKLMQKNDFSLNQTYLVTLNMPNKHP